MDDSCAVCADTLEWVAYGSCGHREVCSTCVVRLRFVLNDRRCCLCKVESAAVFVTKALGDYTRIVTDFSTFPSGASEGQVGEYWYHEDSQAYFDDVDHYKMIGAMCKLSCSVCDGSPEEQGGEGSKRKAKFKNIEQLKGHLFHMHKLFMCSLCLEGRKVFICEQRLYSKVQLNQHISSGDSEVDGSESERGGFMGHPMCEFCKNPFYGDNELYMHMSREHYTCHICQRQRPGQYDYFRNYDDLEIHFRQEHYICEDEACLAKKFIVFQSESELKRHNAVEHAGHMSRSKRNAVLQIPTSFSYRRRSRLEQRDNRGHEFRSDSSNNQLALAIQASLETAYLNGRARDTGPAVSEHSVSNQNENAVASSFDSVAASSSSELPSRSRGGIGQISNLTILEDSSFPALSDRGPSVPSSGFPLELGISRGRASLAEDAFPPLPGASGSITRKAKHSGKTLTAQTAKSHGHNKAGPKANQAWSTGNHGSVPSSSTSSLQTGNARNQKSPAVSSSVSSTQHAVTTSFPQLSINSADTKIKSVRLKGFVTSNSDSYSLTMNRSNKLNHSLSAPSLVERGSLSNLTSTSTLPNSNGNSEFSTSRQLLQNVEDVRIANKSLVEKIRASLEMDEDKFSAFKSISAEYRQGLIGTAEYLSYVQQFGLSHLVIDLAKLCPDPLKQKEMVDIYHANLRTREANSAANSSEKNSIPSKRKGKSVDQSHSSTLKDALADNILNTVKELQSNYKQQAEEVEVLSKDGYRSAAKGKLALMAGGEKTESKSVSSNPSTGASDLGQKGGNEKQSRKTSKFHRVRLGEGSAATLLDLSPANISPETNHEKPSRGRQNVWRNGTAQKLFTTSTRNLPT